MTIIPIKPKMRTAQVAVFLPMGRVKSAISLVRGRAMEEQRGRRGDRAELFRALRESVPAGLPHRRRLRPDRRLAGLSRRLRDWLLPAAASIALTPLAWGQAPFSAPPQVSPAADEGRVWISSVETPTVPPPAPPTQVPSDAPAVGAPSPPVFGPPTRWDLAPAYAPIPLGLSKQARHNRPQSLVTGNMIGDALGNYGSVELTAINSALGETLNAEFDLPLSTRIPKVAENNSPVPRDRAYFTYNMFANAYRFQSLSTPDDPGDPDDPILPVSRSRSHSQSRFTIGLEKAFFHDDMSLELRVPLVTQAIYSSPASVDPSTTAFRAATQDPTGNVAINFKQVLLDWYGDRTSGVLTWGLGLGLPTAEGAEMHVYDVRFEVRDSSVHFTPYLAFLMTESHGLFFQGFFQFDISNTSVKVRQAGIGEVGKMSVPNAAHIDLGLGYWLYHNPHRRCLQGIAPVVEFHYTGQLDDLETFDLNLATPDLLAQATINPGGGRRDIYNITTGVNVAMTRWMNLRSAGVFPLRSRPDRDFDAEFVFQVDIAR